MGFRGGPGSAAAFQALNASGRRFTAGRMFVAQTLQNPKTEGYNLSSWPQQFLQKKAMEGAFDPYSDLMRASSPVPRTPWLPSLSRGSIRIHRLWE